MNVSLTDLWNDIKHTNICIILPEEDKEKGAERLFEEIVKKYTPNLMKNESIHLTIQQTES